MPGPFQVDIAILPPTHRGSGITAANPAANVCATRLPMAGATSCGVGRAGSPAKAWAVSGLAGTGLRRPVFVGEPLLVLTSPYRGLCAVDRRRHERDRDSPGRLVEEPPACDRHARRPARALGRGRRPGCDSGLRAVAIAAGS